MSDENVLFDERFLEKHVGHKLLNDPVSATLELIANAWDAGATDVRVRWPAGADDVFSVEDNGAGLSESDFRVIWRTLNYNRRKEKGRFAEDPDFTGRKRIAFGQNGIGRFAAFYFGDEYVFLSRYAGQEFACRVSRNAKSTPFSLEFFDHQMVGDQPHGSSVVVPVMRAPQIDAATLRAEVGMRFAADPQFHIYINDRIVTLSDIGSDNIESDTVQVDNVGTIEILTIDTMESDRTTRLHGLAWRVNNRLVGDISWDQLSSHYNIDGRRVESKRYAFVIHADVAHDVVLPDWSGFDRDNPKTKRVEDAVFPFVWTKIRKLGREKRREELNGIRKSIEPTYKRLTPKKQEMWDTFVESVQESCPSISVKDLTSVAGILAKLEVSEGAYSLLENLNELESRQLDDLNLILEEWTIDYAKVVLDELRSRMELLNEFERKLYSKKADEVHELQPLFHRGLWIFGPEYETIEFTSNRGMTTVIQSLFGKDVPASSNRPDFAILPDSTVGLYSYPRWDDAGNDVGIDRLTIVELKAPGIKLRETEIEQPWKYVKELYTKGVLDDVSSRVTCFVVGESIEQYEAGERKKANELVVIRPLVYDTVIRRAKSRLFKLYDRMKDAPFMTKIDSKYTDYFQLAAEQPSLGM